MLIDTTLFFNESDMLEFRLRMLWDIVDKFVVIEASHTFSGKEKPFNFDPNRFAWAKDKIDYYEFHPGRIWDGTSPPECYDETHPCWWIEHDQRNFINTVLNEYPDDSLILIGDVDEIPSPDALKMVLDNKICNAVFLQYMFYYNLKFTRRDLWKGTVITDMKTLKIVSAQDVRDARNSLDRNISHGGWHLSYFGQPDAIKKKIESISHAELNIPRFKSDDHIMRCIATGEDLFDRYVKTFPIAKDQFPEYFRDKAAEGWWV